MPKLDFDRRKDITGEESEEYILLYRIWQEFNYEKEKEEKGVESSTELEKIYDEANVTVNNECESMIELCNNNTVELMEWEIENIPIIFSDTDINTTKMENNNYIVLQDTMNNEKTELQDTTICNVDVHEILKFTTEGEQTFVDESEGQEMIKMLEDNKNVDKNLEDILHWPKTPKRKGKNVDRISYVLTGTQWRERKRKLEEEKVRKELEKEERKKKRTQNMATKLETKGLKSKQI